MDNYIRYVFMFLVVMTCLSGCNDEVDIYSKNDYLPVIYSLYCPDDSIINIRVGRTFQGDQSAFQSAKEPDTAFIRSLKVSIEFVDINGTYLFARQEIRPVLLPDKEPGLFYRAPNYSFCAKTTFPYQLDPLQTGIMRLIVFDPALNRYSVAESPVLGRTKIVAPRNDLGTLGASLYNNPPFSVKYMDVGAAYEIRVVFYYSEIGVGDMEVRDSVSWNYPVQYENTEVVSYHDAKLTEIPFGGDDFYKNLSRRIRVDHQVNRLFKSFSIHMSVSDPAFRIYQNFLNSGLDIDAHIISNITNGIGFFSVVRRSEVNNIRLDIRSLDSLCNGQFTRNLGFKKW